MCIAVFVRDRPESAGCGAVEGNRGQPPIVVNHLQTKDLQTVRIAVFMADTGLRTKHDRGLGSVVTIANYDGTTQLTKFVNTPVSGLDVGRSKYHDYYTDATTYERWEHVYNGSNVLVEIIAPDASTYMEATYNTKGSVTAMRAGNGPWEYWTYEADGVRVATYTDAAGVVTEYDYDVDGRLSKVTHPSVHADGYR